MYNNFYIWCSNKEEEEGCGSVGPCHVQLCPPQAAGRTADTVHRARCIAAAITDTHTTTCFLYYKGVYVCMCVHASKSL